MAVRACSLKLLTDGGLLIALCVKRKVFVSERYRMAINCMYLTEIYYISRVMADPGRSFVSGVVDLCAHIKSGANLREQSLK